MPKAEITPTTLEIIFILAGGKSSRMGQDKARMTLKGKPLLRHTYDVAATVCPRVAVISPWPERYHPILPEICYFVQEPLSPSGTRPPGPLMGFLQGLEWLETSDKEVAGRSAVKGETANDRWVLLLACDLPRLHPQPLQTGAAQLSTLPSEVLALVPRHQKGWEPLCGFYRRACLGKLREFVQTGGQSFQHWLAEIEVHPWDLDSTLLFNCNTVADWELVAGSSQD